MQVKAKSKKTVGLICADKVGSRMAGPGIRYFELAKELSNYFLVKLFVPDSHDIAEKLNFDLISYNSRRASGDLGKKITGCNVIIAQSLRPPLLSKIRRRKVKFIADLYDPLAIEVLEYTKDDNTELRQSTFDFNYYSLALQLAFADHILCASERQRDYYSGVLSGKKILGPTFYDQSPNLDKFFTIAPFGLAKNPPKAKNPNALWQKFSGIKKGDKIIYWGGGIWNWFDPLSAIQALEILAKKRQDIKLFFLGMKHPNPKIKAMEAANSAFEYAKSHKLIDKYVFFNFGWTPYNDRIDYLTPSAIGISTHFNNIETRFSFRTRILDYLWAGLPMILTKGDSFADLCEKKNLGVVVDFESPDEIADAIEKIVDDKKFTSQIKKNIAGVQKDFYWQAVAKNIAETINENRYMPPEFSLINVLNLTFDFYKAGIKKNWQNNLKE